MEGSNFNTKYTNVHSNLGKGGGGGGGDVDIKEKNYFSTNSLSI